MNPMPSLNEPAIKAALDDIEGLVASAYTGARFERFVRDDPFGAYLYVEIDIDDVGELWDIYSDRLLSAQAEGLPIYVSLEWSADERTAIAHKRFPAGVYVPEATAVATVIRHRARRKPVAPPAAS